jgi:glycosyltransferase involved in cell wall biosynthesis
MVAAAGGGPLRVLILTNTRIAERFRAYRPGEAPDPGRERRILAEHGVDAILYDRGRFPWNPFARAHPFYAGLDPLRALRIVLFERDADLVLCIFESTALFLCLLRGVFRFKPPIVLMEVNARDWRPRNAVLDAVLPRVDRVIALTRRQAAYVGRTWRTKRVPVVLDWVVDEMFYAPRPDPGHGYILAVGDDVSRDYATLVAACAEIDRELVLRTSRAVAIPESMAGHVRVITARLSHHELRDLYAGAAVVAVPLHPTDHPGGISTALEAMAMGRPVVTSDTGTTSELIEHGGSGLLVPPGDPAALRDAIGRVLADGAFASGLGRGARARVETAYAMSVRHRKLADLLRSFVASP